MRGLSRLRERCQALFRPQRPPFRRKLLFEALEPRLLLSADLNPGAGHAPQPPGALVQTLESEPVKVNMAAAPRAIVFLDPTLREYAAQFGDANVVVLDRERDGVAQITEFLERQSDVDAIHVVTHGNADGADVGDATLGGSTIASHADQLATWRDALTEDADILLYGCDVGADSAFLERLPARP